MTKRDYYEVLGIKKGASLDELRAAYRNLAKKVHPDINKEKGAEDKFKEINEAYQVLSDPNKRQVYDQYGHEGISAQAGAGGFGGERGFGNFEGFGDINDIFGDIFENIFTGGGAERERGRSRPTRGEDLQIRLTVSLYDVLTGTQKTMKVNHAKHCQKCLGSGAKSGSNLKTCAQCKGSGAIHIRQGFFSLSQTCSRCHGKGRVIDSPCDQCHGQGKIRLSEPITVKIPPGVQEGTALKVPGTGEAGSNGGMPGDLYVVIHVDADPRFERRDDDLLVEQKISITQAALGAEIEVMALDGKVTLRIPPGTQTGTVFRIRERGLPHLGGRGRGDQLAKIIVEVPSRLSEKQKLLLKELAQTFGEEEAAKGEDSFIKKVFGK